MARAKEKREEPSVLETVLAAPEASLLDVIDRLLNKGVMATGDVTLGVAGIDLIYLRLSTILCAADRMLPPGPDRPPRRSRHRAPARRGGAGSPRGGAAQEARAAGRRTKPARRGPA
jgi:hypothetical protein